MAQNVSQSMPPLETTTDPLEVLAKLRSSSGTSEKKMLDIGAFDFSNK